mgnify:CR=1 FL=1
MMIPVSALYNADPATPQEQKTEAFKILLTSLCQDFITDKYNESESSVFVQGFAQITAETIAHQYKDLIISDD